MQIDGSIDFSHQTLSRLFFNSSYQESVTVTLIMHQCIWFSDSRMQIIRFVFIVLEHRRMIKTSKVTPLHLPHINKPKFMSSTHRGDVVLESGLEEENDHIQVQMLDHWTARNYNVKKGQPIQRSPYKKQSLYRQFNQKKLKTMAMTEEVWLMEPKLFLLRLDNELQKVHDINYDSMYKNIEYCSGFYELFYRDIFKTLDKLIETVQSRYQTEDELVKKKRLDHIKSMETLRSSALTHKINISQIRQTIQNREEEVEKLKTVLDQLLQARNKVLKHALMIGYDVREEGLLWIIRELGYFPENAEFPPFLNDKQIWYLRKKFEKEQKLSDTSQQMILQNLGKTSEEVYEIVTRKKKRELSMIKEGEILKQLKMNHNLLYSNMKHRYIDEEVLKMAEVEFPKTKSTQYEIIYKETSKKLNKYCINEIYKKNHHKKQKAIIDARKESMNTLKILSHFQTKIEEHMRKVNHGKELQSQEEKELDQIVRSLRYESYQDSPKLSPNSRKVISILCCLLGAKKAKRLIEQQLNHLF